MLVFNVYNKYTFYTSHKLSHIIKYLVVDYLKMSSYNEIDYTLFLQKYKIIIYDNTLGNIILHTNAMYYYNDFITLLNTYKPTNMTKQNKQIQNEQIQKLPSIKQNNNKQNTNNNKQDTNKNIDLPKYTSIFTDTTVIEEKNSSFIKKIDDYLNLDKSKYDITKLTEFITFIKNGIMKEPLHEITINKINNVIPFLMEIYSKFKNTDKQQELSTSIEDLITILSDRIKQYDITTLNHIKQMTNVQTDNLQNKKNTYESNKNVYDTILNSINPQSKLNKKEDIHNSQDIPDSFKDMFYAYSNSDNLDQFIYYFNEYITTYNTQTLFPIFINNKP